MKNTSEVAFTEFLSALHSKLDRGEKEYGDHSFHLSTDTLLKELQEEALDLAGWGFLLWTKIQRLKDRESK